MTMKKAGLALLWIISILGTMVLMAFFTRSTAWEWETNPWVRRIKHWPEPVVAFVGDVPIFQFDLWNIYEGLSPQLRDNFREQKASNALVKMTVDAFLWRGAAQSYGIFQSIYPSRHLEDAKNTISKTWLDEQIFTRNARPTESQIQSFIAQNPMIFTKRIIHYREDRYRGPTLISRRQGSITYPGSSSPAWLMVLLSLPAGRQSTALLPCDADLCRYTEEGQVDVEPAFDADRAKLIAEFQIIDKKKTDWLTAYQKLHPVKIKRQDLIDKVLH